MTDGSRSSIYKVTALIFALLIGAFSMFSCDGGVLNNDETETDDGESVPLVTMMQLESDSADKNVFEEINTAASESANENGAYYNIYEIKGKSSEEITDALFDAASEKPDLIICVGAAFTLSIDEVAPIYDEVNFLSVDAGLHTESNVATINYAEEEAGFVAGYLAVANGYRNIGFLGSMETPDIINNGFGFLQGIDFAAKKYGVLDELSVNYVYAGSFTESEYSADICKSWYEDGTELVFAEGTGMALSVSKAAKESDVKIIAYDAVESVDLKCETLYINLNYETVIKGVISSFVTNGCKWHNEVSGGAFKLDASDEIFCHRTNKEGSSFDEKLFDEALSILAKDEYVPVVYEKFDVFPEVDFNFNFYDE